MRGRAILLMPFLIFGIGVNLFLKTEHEVRVQFERAQAQWRAGLYRDAIRSFGSIHATYPESHYAPLALFESASLMYIAAVDLEQSVALFKHLLDQYPQHGVADQARLSLAQIYENELQDPDRAIYYWTQLIHPEAPPQQLHEALFKVGRTLFEQARFDEAIAVFNELRRDGIEDYIAQQADLCLGTIYQLQKDYRTSLTHFQAVLQYPGCVDCRLQAQLGMIESFEFLDDLGSAIKMAEQLDAEHYAPQLKQDLLDRLQEKRQFYEPQTWNN